MNVPTISTLKKYGLTEQDFLSILERQGGVCAICGKVPNGHWVIDHSHVRGWKKMPPERRKLYVRGVVDWFCNHYYLGRSLTIPKAENVVRYLKDFAERLNNEEDHRHKG